MSTEIDPVEVPVSPDTPLYTERVTLDGQEFLFRFDWNGREGRWYLDVGDIDEAWIVTGIKIVANMPLLRRCVDPRRPKGILMAIDLSTQKGEPPDLTDLGRRVKLFYFAGG